MDIKQLIETLQSVQLPSQTDAMEAVNQAVSPKELERLCDMTEDGAPEGYFADLHIRALRRFIAVSKPSDLNKYSIAWMAGMHDSNIREDKKEILREACDKGGAFTEVFLDAGDEDGRSPDEVGNLSLSSHGCIVLICRDGDWEVSLEQILGEPMGVKSVVLSNEWDVEDSRISEFLKKLSDNYLPDLEDISIFNVNGERFEKWTHAFRNADLVNGAKALKRLFVEADGEFVPSAGAAKVQGQPKCWNIMDATFVYEGEALKRLLACG